MLLTKHKLLLLGAGWFSLAMLALAGLVAYAVLDVPLPALPPTAAALAYAAPPTPAPPRPAGPVTITQDTTPATSTPTLALVVKSPTPSTTPSATDTPTATASPSATARPTRTRAPSPTASPAGAQATEQIAASATNTPVMPNQPSPTPAPPNTPAPPPTPTNTSAPPTVAPPPPPVPIADFWGINGGPIDGNASTFPLDGDLSYFPTLRDNSFYWMNQAGLRWFRNYGSDSINFSWRFVEPAAGVYDWSAWDNLVLAAQKRDISLLASIGNGVPQWANGSADWRIPPTDLSTNPMQNTAWYQYVQHVVERYDGDGQSDMPGLTRPIKFWELWNEPDLRESQNPSNYPAHQFSGDINAYIRLSQVGYSAVKAADPGAQVVGPASAQVTINGERSPWFLWTWGDWMAAGGLSYVDVVSFHLYLDRNNWDPSGQVDQILDGLDAARGGKPVWVTEIGWDGGTTSDYADKDNNFVRSVVLLWQRPSIQHYFWYDLQESETFAGTHNHGFLQTLSGGASRGIDPDPLFHPIFRVAQVMARLLAGFGAGARPAPVDVGGAARAFHFSRAGQEVWVVWQRAAGGTTAINLDTGGRTLRVVDLYGGSGGAFAGGALTVGPAPIYLTTQLDWNPNLGTITGRVRHAGLAGQWANGAAGASVTLSGPVSAATSTNGDGNYQFDGLPEGDYVVAVAGASQDVTVSRTGAWGRTSFAASP